MSDEYSVFFFGTKLVCEKATILNRVVRDIDNLGKKKSKRAQDLLDSLIPMGMLFGCAIGAVFGMFFPIPLVFTVSLGAGIGYLIGFFAYEIYSKKGNNHS
ncbi:hypothetical protein BGM26_04450 [Bacillus sp. FJAT-29790]|nr:hypothetical protein [Bacillus sp. FJAT-29790]